MAPLRDLWACLANRRRILLAVMVGVCVGVWAWRWPPAPRATLSLEPGKLYPERLYFSPDSRRVATVHVYPQLGRTLVQLWDVATGNKGVTLYEGSGQLEYLAFCPSGKVVAGLWFDRHIDVWDPDTGRLVATYPSEDRPDWHPHVQIAFSPEGRLLIYGPQVTSGKLWDVATGREVTFFYDHEKEGNIWASTGRSGFLLAGDAGRHAKAWRMDTGELSGTFAGFETLDTSALSADGKLIAARERPDGPEGEIQFTVWNSETGEQKHLFYRGGIAHSIALSPDGSATALCATPHASERLRLLTWLLGLFSSTQPGHKDPGHRVQRADRARSGDP
jgi:WD40 repeat protein